MKIYVDEFPKDCIDCPCESEYYCNLLKEGVDCCKYGEIHKDCPLQSLSDHDKQVRKEVCEEIMNIIIKKDKKLEKSNYSDSFVSGYHCCYCDVKQILDQIQGE